MAKSKLPSLQVKYTIPKLELNAMTLAMRLCNSVLTELRDTLNIREVYVFSDSQIVLSWLKKKPEHEVGPFVYRRITEIRNIAHHITMQRCMVRIGYIASQDNPADCATRGTTKEELQNHPWWEGPHFLQYTPLHWPCQKEMFQFPLEDAGACTSDLRESDEILTINTRENNDVEILHNSQVRTWTHAKRIMAYALRFLRALIKRINSKGCICLTLPSMTSQYLSHNTGPLTAPEVRESGLTLLRHHQNVHVTPQVIDSLQQLNIHRDEQGIFRCHGRLGHAQLDSDTKNPVLVIQKTLLAEIIIRDAHQQGHPGSTIQ
uniref:RNase H domain-containing protein n=1 Tax=Haemonchus contortus TaxID=6289 RepID=A0A7I4Z3G5_HAECO